MASSARAVPRLTMRSPGKYFTLKREHLTLKTLDGTVILAKLDGPLFAAHNHPVNEPVGRAYGP
ncbi:MAG: hypothetical protein ACREKB_03855, partial [Candidatus Rokuibacteriota bacterium]